MTTPLYFITGNANKFHEIRAIVPDIQQLNLDLDEIQSLDPQAVIEHKLAQAATQHDGEFIVEDTTVELACLGGLPGPFIKWFLDRLGAAGIADLALRYDDHSVLSRVTIGHRRLDGQIRYFVGEYHGQIVAPRGHNGFGFDPIFMADGKTQTNAELTTAEKNQISSRGVAARKLKAYLESISQ